MSIVLNQFFLFELYSRFLFFCYIFQKGVILKFFTYNDYLDYLQDSELMNKIRAKEKSIRNDMNEKMMHRIDKLFLELINQENEVADFLKECITTQFINVNRSNIQKCIFECSSVKNNRAIVYKLIDKEIYFVMQYEIEVNFNVGYNILEYCMNIMNEWKSKEKSTNERYPIIFPIIIYTGKEKWGKSYKEIRYVRVLKNGMYFAYNIIDAADYSREELLNKCSLIFNLMLLKKVNKNEIKRVMIQLIKNCRDSKKIFKFQKIFKFVCGDYKN